MNFIAQRWICSKLCILSLIKTN